MAAARNKQLDGWRTFAVAGVMWVHWSPDRWHKTLPFELGLFYFLTLTGFLLTRILLRERALGEAQPAAKWRLHAYLRFEKRRILRILVPCYAAMVFAIAVGAPDIRSHPLAYFGHWANFHIAFLDQWPSGTSHYWTLALQVQFYLVWPLVVLLVPQRHLAAAMAACVALAPASRAAIEWWFPAIRHGEAITSTAMDYFGCGALLALAMARGMAPGDKRLRNAAWVAFAGYAALYTIHEIDGPVPGLRYFQQTLVSVAFAGLISSTLAGFRGRLGNILEHPATQHIARLSFGFYLFHTPVPLLLGWVLPWLWDPALATAAGAVLRMTVFFAVSWVFAYFCWRFLEGVGAPATPRAAASSPDR